MQHNNYNNLNTPEGNAEIKEYYRSNGFAWLHSELSEVAATNLYNQLKTNELRQNDALNRAYDVYAAGFWVSYFIGIITYNFTTTAENGLIGLLSGLFLAVMFFYIGKSKM